MTVTTGHGRPEVVATDGTDITRYLCAAAYLNPAFAGDVVDEVVLQPGRAVAPAPGADVTAVTRHSLDALRRTTRRDIALTVIVVAVVLLAGLPGLLIAVWVFSWALLARALRTLGRGEAGAAFAQVTGFLLVSAGCLVVLYWNANRDQPVASGSSAGVIPLSAVQILGLVVAALWIVNFLDRVYRYGVLAQALARGRFSAAAAPLESPRWRDRLAYVAASSGSNLVVSAQDAPTAPFAGFGAVVHTWSAHCRLESRMGSAPARAPLTGPQVLAGLLAGGRSAGFATAELVLTPGWLPPGHFLLEPGTHRPVPGLPPMILRDLAAQPPGGRESYYVVWSSSADAAGAVASGFVQAGVRDRQLTIEVALTVLPPVDASYRIADRFGPAGLVTLGRLLGSSFIDIGRRTPLAPVSLVRSAIRTWSRREAGPAGAGRTRAGDGQDHGARAGVRELAAIRAGSSPPASDYEVTRQVNQLSRELVGAITRLLSERGLDPEPFRAATDPVWAKTLTPTGYQSHPGHQSYPGYPGSGPAGPSRRGDGR